MSEFNRHGRFGRLIANTPVAIAARFGLSLGGANVLSVKGRTSGAVRTTPVNPLSFQGKEYLVAPRGETFWVRNLRAARVAELRLGSRSTHIIADELDNSAKPEVIAAYLDKWGGITRKHFGTTAKSPDRAELERLAARTPVFLYHRS